MTRISRRDLIATVCILVVMVTAVALWCLRQPCPIDGKRKDGLFEDTELIRDALLSYASDHQGILPYDRRGVAFALYKLRPYFPKLPSILPPEVWGPDRIKIHSDLIGYVNQPRDLHKPAGLPTDADIVLWVTHPRGRLCITAAGLVIRQPSTNSL